MPARLVSRAWSRPTLRAAGPADRATTTGWRWVSERGQDRARPTPATQVAALKDAPAGDDRDPAAVERRRGSRWRTCSRSAALMSVVHPDAAVMEAAESLRRSRRGGSAPTSTSTRDVFAQLSSLDGADALDAGARRVPRRRAARASGAPASTATTRRRERLRELNRRESELSQAFSRGIRDGRRTTHGAGRALDGLPEDYVADHPADDDGRGARSARTTPTRCRSSPTHRDPERGAAVAHAVPQHRLAGQRRRAGRAARGARGEGPPAGVRRLAELRRRGQDDRRRDGGSRRSSTEIAAAADEAGAPGDRRAARAARAPRARTSSTSPTGATTSRRSSASGSTSTPRRCAATSTVAKVRQGLLDVTARLFGLSYEPVSTPRPGTPT